MEYDQERDMEIPCGNKKCQYLNERFEANCCAETSDGDPYIIDCKEYIPREIKC